MPTVIQNIERLIYEHGLKKKYVAEKAGYSAQQLCDMLAGRRQIKAEDISTLSKALGVTPNDLFERPEQ